MTECDVINMALASLGDFENAVSSPDGSAFALAGQTAAERAGKLHYAQSRREVMGDAAIRWNELTRRARLTEANIAPAFGRARAFLLPADCLAVVAVCDKRGVEFSAVGMPYELEGGRLLTNAGEAFVRYVADQPDPGQWTTMLLATVTARLAAQMAGQLRGQGAEPIAWEKYQLARAAAINFEHAGDYAEGEEGEEAGYAVFR